MDQIETIDGQTMGGTYRLRFAVTDNNPDIKIQVQALLDMVETQMSGWKDSSDLNRFNNAALNEWVPIPPEMTNVVMLGLQMSQETNGALNICMGENSRIFGHGADVTASNNPVSAAVDPMNVLELDAPNRMLRRNQNIRLDLNSIAKGFAVDLVVFYLKKTGITDFIIEVAGDIYASGKRPNGMPWSVAIELPLPDKSVPLCFVPLVDYAIATSGNYRRFNKTQNGIAGHLITPKTGQALSEIYASVSVLAPFSVRADGLATALFVMGASAGFKFAEKNNIAATFITRTTDGFKEEGTSNMHALLGLNLHSGRRAERNGEVS